MSPTDWSFEPLFLVLAAVAAVAYWRAARVERPSRRRVALFALGLALVVVPLDSPLETVAAHYLLLVHLLQNALIADWAPPLLLLGLTPAMRAGIRRRGGRPLALVTRPTVALPLWVVAWYGVHFPAFYGWALREGWPLNLEHAILTAAGLAFWWALVEPAPRRLSTAGSLAYLGLAFVASPWLSLAYIFSTKAFYDFYVDAPRLWGLTPTKDQNLGGILMQAEQTIVLFTAMTYFLLRLLEEEHDENRLDHAPSARPPEDART